MGFSFTEAMTLPVAYKKFFIERVNKELEKSTEGGDARSRALHHNDPTTRSLQNMTRDKTPARLRRFT